MVKVNKLKAIWQLARLGHGFMLGFAVIVGAVIAGDLFIIPFDTLLISLSLGFMTALFIEAGTFALNDYYDIEVDRANERFDRPLVRGDIEPNTALIIAVFAIVLGIACSSLINIWCFSIALVTALFGIFYDIKLKEAGIIGNIYIAFTMAIPFVFGGFIFQKSVFVLIVLSLITFLAGLGREIMKGIIDVEGDALRDVKTIARVYGVRRAGTVSIFLYMAAVLLSPLPFIFDLGGFRNYPYLVVVFIADIIFIYTCLKLYRSEDRDVVNNLRRTTIVAMLFGLIAFLSGALSYVIGL
ncbi:MAG: UbiA family prenyltransferase [Halobacteriota archaeon]|nr:UbiA family prenyltransferase [Halobacteriota archaeon]